MREGETLATELEALTETEAYDRLETAVGAKPGDTSLSTVQETLAELDLDLSETAHSLGDALLEAVGPVSVRWEHSQDDHRVVSADQTGPLPAREPDIRPEMIAEFYPIESVDEFQEAFVHHLRCQVRDCYLEMGIAPPRPFRTLGPGFYENIGWYAHHEFYPDYHDYQAEITDWGEEHTPVDLY
ncbi:hypothetical protein [Natronobiforma cellulositropha]|uniref:hypothetical protein n=1 Tax=Natronobiforma cellulositropha TaxID=1679076 RepID=UPI0021D59030|nr:hypothetical protein [Natronobiforma cellulositropha]